MTAIKKYIEFQEKYPKYFKQDKDLKIITDQRALQRFASEQACQLGLIYETPLFWIVVDLLESAEGRRYPYMRMIHKAESNGVVIIPQIDDKIVFLSQFRHGTRQIEIELPRGFAEIGLSAFDNAAKEISEEIGANAEKLTLLGTIMSDSGLTYGDVSILHCHIESIGKLENEEGIKDTLLLSKGDILNYIQTNKIRDSFSISAIMKWLIQDGEER